MAKNQKEGVYTMTSGSQLGEITHPTKVRVTPKQRSRTEIFERVKVVGDEAILREFGSYIKAGGTVTILETEHYTVDKSPCKLGRVDGNDPRKHLVIMLTDDIEIEPLPN